MTKRKKLPNTIIRSRVYHFKKRVPTHLRHTSEFQGKEFVQHSLNESDASAAVMALARANREFERRVGAAESELGRTIPFSPADLDHIPLETGRKPNFNQIQQVADAFFDDYILVNSLDEDGIRTRDIGNLELLIAGKREIDWEERLNQLNKPGELNEESFKAALEIYIHNGWEPDPEDKLFNVLQDMLRKAERTAIQQIIDDAQSDTFIPNYKRERIAERQADRRYTITEAVDDYAKLHPQHRDMIKKMRLSLQAWSDIAGIDSFAAIDGLSVVDFKEALERLPKSASQRFPGLSLKEAIEENSKRTEPYPTLSAKSVKVNYIGVLNTAAGLALERKRINSNPFFGIRVKGSRKLPKHRRPFTSDELNAIFQQPIFTGCQSITRRYTGGDKIYRDSYFWTPLIGLFTGMRASEIGALKPDNLKQVSVSGTDCWYIQVDGGKTENALRQIPVHPELETIGFIEFCKEKKASGADRLFDEWQRPSGKKYSEARVIRNFNERICSKLGDPWNRPTFHCFRQTLQTAMVRAELQPTVQNAILGHSQDRMKAHYYKASVSDYAVQFCERVCFENLELKHLYK